MKKINNKYLLGSIISIITLIVIIVIMDSGLFSQSSQKEIKEEIKERKAEKLSHYQASKGEGSLDQKLEIGLLYVQDGEYAKAKDIYLEVLKDDPENLLAIHRLGNLAIEEKDFDEALEYREKYVKLDPYSFSGYYYYSQILLVKDIELSKKMADKALQLADPGDSTIQSYQEIINKIYSGKAEGYKDLINNDDIFIPETLKDEIISKSKS